MTLVELEATFISKSTTDSTRIGVGFLCPACRKQMVYVPIADPDRSNWGHTGETIETLTLTPSVDARHVNGGLGTDEPRSDCHWHGFVRDGQVIPC